jgi:hypothetical protein
MSTVWWWKRFDDENDLMMRTIYFSTLNWVDKEFFLIFLYIASLEQTWQNSSNINSKIELRALISSIRSNINPRIGFELLSEIQFYGQAINWHINMSVDQVILDQRGKRSFESYEAAFIEYQRSSWSLIFVLFSINK